VPDGAIIKAAEVSGASLNQLSDGLREAINALAGTPLNRDRVRDVAARIESENPETVAAVRTVPLSGGEVRIVFLIARISDDVSLTSNINARYEVESVEIEGIDESDLPRALRDQLQDLVGRRLDSDEADELHARLENELPDHDIARRVERGSQPGLVRLVFDVTAPEAPAWIPFAPSRSKFVYHGDLGWSGVLDIPMGGDHHRVTAGFVFDNDDDLVEEYGGYRLRYESRRLATERLGISLEFSDLRQTWREATLAALAADPDIPEIYRKRRTFEPLVTVAFTPHVRARAGTSISELESEDRAPESQMASAFVLGFAYDQRLRPSYDITHDVAASYELRAGTTSLESDLDYRRHLGRASYRYRRGSSRVTTSLMFGGITGRAPIFERFSLGDTSTLRGWNKYDIAPAGGTRMFHHSLDYTFHRVGVFLDTGSIWEPGGDVRTRVSTGFGLQAPNVFLTVGVPLNADNVGATFMMGVRF
jgi:hypothetical protein